MSLFIWKMHARKTAPRWYFTQHHKMFDLTIAGIILGFKKTFRIPVVNTALSKIVEGEVENIKCSRKTIFKNHLWGKQEGNCLRSHLLVLGASVQGVGLGPFQAYAAATENTSNFSLHKGKQERSGITSHLASKVKHRKVLFRQTCPGLCSISLENTTERVPAARLCVWSALLKLLWTGRCLLLHTGYHSSLLPTHTSRGK